VKDNQEVYEGSEAEEAEKGHLGRDRRRSLSGELFEHELLDLRHQENEEQAGMRRQPEEEVKEDALFKEPQSLAYQEGDSDIFKAHGLNFGDH
jgi:hypothetical protein